MPADRRRPTPSSTISTTHRVAPTSHRDVDVLGMRVLAGVRERLGDDEVRGALDRRRPALVDVDADADVERRPARRAPRSPPRARGRRAPADGCRARGRAAPRAPRVRPGARRRAARAPPSGSDASFCSAMPRLMPSATSRACAPSCRSRSMRRSSASCWSTAPARRRLERRDPLGERRRCARPDRARTRRATPSDDEEDEDRPDRPEVAVAE